MPNDIGFDDKSKEGIQHLFREVGPSKETQRYITITMKMRQISQKHMNKVFKKFYPKHKVILMYYHTDLKGESQEYDI